MTTRSTIRALLTAFDSLGTVQQAAILTLPLLLLYVEDQWYINVPVTILAISGLIFSSLRTNAYFWFAVVCVTASGIFYNWYVADNHKYLITYWCLALFFVCLFNVDDSGLKNAARLLIGLAFCFAFLWKLITPDFLNGGFFEYTFLFDNRFSNKLGIFGMLHPEATEFNRLADDALTTYDSNLKEVDLLTSYSLRQVAKGLAWWTILLEGLIAVCFLIPHKHRVTAGGDLLLITFLLSTYLIAPVIGFGWVIATMGFVQCDDSRWRTRAAYLFTILILQAYRLPWSAFN